MRAITRQDFGVTFVRDTLYLIDVSFPRTLDYRTFCSKRMRHVQNVIRDRRGT
jgi:hypothetical protein